MPDMFDPGVKFDKEELLWRLYYSNAREWSTVHGRQIHPLPLKEGIERRIREWFTLVDDDGSGALDTDELAYALKASGIPANVSAILEMIKMFDFDKDGEINWAEFHHFLCYEVMAGKDPLGTEYVLPSGLALPIRSMIAAIRRKKMMEDIEQGGPARDRWLVEGPDLLRHLLEEERYEFDGADSRELLGRILKIKPPLTARSGVQLETFEERLEQQRRRITEFQQVQPPAADSATGSHQGGAAGSGDAAATPARASMFQAGFRHLGSTSKAHRSSSAASPRAAAAERAVREIDDELRPKSPRWMRNSAAAWAFSDAVPGRTDSPLVRGSRPTTGVCGAPAGGGRGSYRPSSSSCDWGFFTEVPEHQHVFSGTANTGSPLLPVDEDTAAASGIAQEMEHAERVLERYHSRSGTPRAHTPVHQAGVSRRGVMPPPPPAAQQQHSHMPSGPSRMFGSTSMLAEGGAVSAASLAAQQLEGEATVALGVADAAAPAETPPMRPFVPKLALHTLPSRSLSVGRYSERLLHSARSAVRPSAGADTAAGAAGAPPPLSPGGARPLTSPSPSLSARERPPGRHSSMSACQSLPVRPKSVAAGDSWEARTLEQQQQQGGPGCRSTGERLTAWSEQASPAGQQGGHGSAGQPVPAGAHTTSRAAASSTSARLAQQQWNLMQQRRQRSSSLELPRPALTPAPQSPQPPPQPPPQPQQHQAHLVGSLHSPSTALHVPAPGGPPLSPRVLVSAGGFGSTLHSSLPASARAAGPASSPLPAPAAALPAGSTPSGLYVADPCTSPVPSASGPCTPRTGSSWQSGQEWSASALRPSSSVDAGGRASPRPSARGGVLYRSCLAESLRGGAASPSRRGPLHSGGSVNQRGPQWAESGGTRGVRSASQGTVGGNGSGRPGCASLRGSRDRLPYTGPQGGMVAVPGRSGVSAVLVQAAGRPEELHLSLQPTVTPPPKVLSVYSHLPR